MSEEHGGTTTRLSDADALAALLELSPDAVVVVDRDGTIRQANAMAAELFRIGLAELSGLTVDELVPERLRGVHAQERAGFHRQPSRRSMGTGRRLRARRRDGTTFPVDISLQPVTVEDVPLVVAVVRDLTAHDQLRRRNDELAQDADMLRRFIDTASHELRTPLTSVLGFAEMLQKNPDMDADRRATLVDRLVRNARREEALISGLLDLSRLHNGKLPLTIEAVDLGTTIADVMEAFDTVDVTCRVPPGTMASGDGLRIEQVLANLLTNALRYGAEPILIEAGAVAGSDPARVRFAVCDSGPGVDARFEASLFTAFSQASTGDQRDAEGLGLGLYLSRELVEAMDGTIRYHATHPSGTYFEVELPAA